jgi:hypothetical protein
MAPSGIPRRLTLKGHTPADPLFLPACCTAWDKLFIWNIPGRHQGSFHPSLNVNFSCCCFVYLTEFFFNTQHFPVWKHPDEFPGIPEIEKRAVDPPDANQLAEIIAGSSDYIRRLPVRDVPGYYFDDDLQSGIVRTR